MKLQRSPVVQPSQPGERISLSPHRSARSLVLGVGRLHRRWVAPIRCDNNVTPGPTAAADDKTASSTPPAAAEEQDAILQAILDGQSSTLSSVGNIATASIDELSAPEAQGLFAQQRSTATSVIVSDLQQTDSERKVPANAKDSASMTLLPMLRKAFLPTAASSKPQVMPGGIVVRKVSDGSLLYSFSGEDSDSSDSDSDNPDRNVPAWQTGDSGWAPESGSINLTRKGGDAAAAGGSAASSSASAAAGAEGDTMSTALRALESLTPADVAGGGSLLAAAAASSAAAAINHDARQQRQAQLQAQAAANASVARVATALRLLLHVASDAAAALCARLAGLAALVALRLSDAARALGLPALLSRASLSYASFRAWSRTHEGSIALIIICSLLVMFSGAYYIWTHGVPGVVGKAAEAAAATTATAATGDKAPTLAAAREALAAAARELLSGAARPFVSLDTLMSLPEPGNKSAMTKAMAAVGEVALERLSWLFQKWSYSSLFTKIITVLMTSVPLVILFGSMYYYTGSAKNWQDAFLKVHSILNRMPGTNMVREENVMSFFVVNLTFFTGLFTFAIFLGIVSDDVKGTFRTIKEGAYPVRAESHVLVLHWNHHTIPLLRQYAAGRQQGGEPFYNRPIVVLADRAKVSMDNEIAERLVGLDLDVITRSGNPALSRDLATVAADKAHTVIVLHPQGASSHSAAEATKAATAMALATTSAPPSQTILFQMPDEVAPEADPVQSFARTQMAPCAGPGACVGAGSSAGNIGSGSSSNGGASGSSSSSAAISGLGASRIKVLALSDNSFIDRFTCLAAVQPGLLRIWTGLLQHGTNSCNIKVVQVPEKLEGRTFLTARRSYRDSIVLGVLRNNTPLFEAIDNTVLMPADKLILITTKFNPQPHLPTEDLYRNAALAAAERLQRSAGYSPPAKRIIIAGYQAHDVPDVAAAFADSAPDGSSITFILPAMSDNLPGGWGSCRLRYVEAGSGRYLTTRALQDGGIKTADAVVLRPPLNDTQMWALPSTSKEWREADSLVMAGLVQVQDAVIVSGRQEPPHVVATVNRFGTLVTARKYFEHLNAANPSAPAQPLPQAQPANRGWGPWAAPAPATAPTPAPGTVAPATAGGGSSGSGAPASSANTSTSTSTQDAGGAGAQVATAAHGSHNHHNHLHPHGSLLPPSAVNSSHQVPPVGSGVGSGGTAQLPTPPPAASSAAASHPSSSSSASALAAPAAAGASGGTNSSSAASSGASSTSPAADAASAAAANEQHQKQTEQLAKDILVAVHHQIDHMEKTPEDIVRDKLAAAEKVAAVDKQMEGVAKEKAQEHLLQVFAQTIAGALGNNTSVSGGASSAQQQASSATATASSSNGASSSISSSSSATASTPPTASGSTGSGTSTSAASSGTGTGTAAPGSAHPNSSSTSGSNGQGAAASGSSATAGSSAASTSIGAGTAQAGAGPSSGAGAAAAAAGQQGGSGPSSGADGSGANGGQQVTPTPPPQQPQQQQQQGQQQQMAAKRRPIIRAPELLLADDMISALLTQVAAQPDYASVITQLVTKEGVEIYLRNTKVFNIQAGEAVTFAEVAETARQLQQVAIGIIKADGRAVLVPLPEQLIEFEAGDQVVVMSADYKIKRKG